MKIFLVLVGFLFGLTWNVQYRAPYYEGRGCFSVEQKLIGVRYIYTWSGKVSTTHPIGI